MDMNYTESNISTRFPVSSINNGIMDRHHQTEIHMTQLNQINLFLTTYIMVPTKSSGTKNSVT